MLRNGVNDSLSHHSFQTKVQTIKQFYRTPEASSSTLEYAEEYKVVIDSLSEHLRFANKPIAPSYNEEAMAVQCTLQTKIFGRNSKFKI